jgi:hypothetical protein
MPTILTKKKDTAGAPAPGDLTNSAGGAELAVNTFDKRLYTKDAGGNVVEIGTNPSTIDTTTVDTTNLEVTNIKAKDGTASATIANSTGIFTHSTATVFPAGTVSAPAITTAGDTNTGIFFPAADTIAFTEGGTEVIRINSSGNVGIGTVSPTEKLQVIGQIIASDGGTQGTQIGSTGDIEISKTAGDAYIDFKTSTAEDYDCRISQISNGLRFLTGGNGASLERVRITSAGRVGVGTSAPSSTLFLSATGTEVPFQFSANTNGASYPAQVLGGSIDSNFSGGSGEFGIWNTFTAAATSFVIRQLTGASSASNLMIIKPNGYVGLGGVDPSSFITVAGGTLSSTAATTIPYFNTTFSTGNGLNLQRSAIRTSAGSDWQTSGYREQLSVDATFQSWMQYNGTTGGVPCIAWGAGGAASALGVAEVMRLTSNGLAIGTTVPTRPLTVSTTAAADNNVLLRSGAANAYICFADIGTTDQTGLSVRLGSAGNAMVFNTGGTTERMRIDSSGNVGINTSGNLNFSARFKVLAATNQQVAEFYGPGSNQDAKLIIANDATTAAVGLLGNSLVFNNAGATTERMRINNSGQVSINSTGVFSDEKLFIVGNTLGGTTGNTALWQAMRGTETSNTTTYSFLNYRWSNGNSHATSEMRLQRTVDASTHGYIGLRDNASFTAGYNATEQMRLDSSGNLCVGRSAQLTGTGMTLSTDGRSVSCTLAIQAHNGSGFDPRIVLEAPGSNSGYFWYSRDNGQIRASVGGETTGVSLAGGATSWGSFSDERMKDIIEPITNAAEKVSSLRAVIGKYKTDEDDKRRSFLIAQDVQAVLPEAVYKNSGDGDMLSLAYTDVIPLLVAAIQEQQILIENLTTRLNALEGK